MHVCVYVRPSVHPSVRMSVGLSVCLSVCLSACVHVCKYACICKCACMQVCKYACMHVHTCLHVHMHACIYVNLNTYTTLRCNFALQYRLAAKFLLQQAPKMKSPKAHNKECHSRYIYGWHSQTMNSMEGKPQVIYKNKVGNQFSQETEDGKTNLFFSEVLGICLEPSSTLWLSVLVDPAALFAFWFSKYAFMRSKLVPVLVSVCTGTWGWLLGDFVSMCFGSDIFKNWSCWTTLSNLPARLSEEAEPPDEISLTGPDDKLCEDDSSERPSQLPVPVLSSSWAKR